MYVSINVHCILCSNMIKSCSFKGYFAQENASSMSHLTAEK